MHLQPEEPVLLHLEDGASLNFPKICTISIIFTGILFAGDFSTDLTPTSLGNSVLSGGAQLLKAKREILYTLCGDLLSIGFFFFFFLTYCLLGLGISIQSDILLEISFEPSSL
jgi:hypothetical protein